jgi:hypothetical protein
MPKMDTGNWLEITPTNDAEWIWGEVERVTRLPRSSFRLRFNDLMRPDSGHVPIVLNWVEVVPRFGGTERIEEEEIAALTRSTRKDWSPVRKLLWIEEWCGGDANKSETAGLKSWNRA